MSKGGYKGDPSPPAAKSTIGGSYNSEDSAGVKDGLSARSDMDSESLHDFTVNNEVDSVTGNPRQCIKPRSSKSVTEKGKSLDMC